MEKDDNHLAGDEFGRYADSQGTFLRNYALCRPNLISDGPSCVGLQVKAVCSVTESEFVRWGWISYSELIINGPCCVCADEVGKVSLDSGVNM
jgi:hydroxyacyl-ACP dehydratase HTD2-like protein with hotdog domain